MRLLIGIELPENNTALNYRLNRDKLCKVRCREGRNLPNGNLTETDPVKLWNCYLQLVTAKDTFRVLKSGLAIPPIFHQEQARIEAHVFLAFLAYGLYVTLGRRLDALAPGLTSRSALEQFATMHMVDVRTSTADGRELSLTRYTRPQPDLRLLLERLRLALPAQPPPKITALEAAAASSGIVKTSKGDTLICQVHSRSHPCESAKFG